ncbi:AMP-binding protein, partial [Pirellulales bacterium]|nr:AMP-binding protein [Pirellulales bacterium]
MRELDRHFDQPPTNFVEVLRQNVDGRPEMTAFRFVRDDRSVGENGSVEQTLTYRQVDECARAIAVELQERQLCGERALLIYDPGLSFVTAFLGCLYAGVLAVPTYLPRGGRRPTLLKAVADDAQPAVVLTSAALISQLRHRLAEHSLLEASEWLATDNVDLAFADRWQLPELGLESVACLQYTSGSTASPTGVMLTHGNLLTNSRLIRDAFGNSTGT